MPRKLTPGSSLDTMKKEAKRWLKALRAREPDARARFDRALPGGPAEPVLRDVQHALAREYGFEGWTALILGVEKEGRARQARLTMYEEQAADVRAAFHGDVPALERLIALFGVSYNPAQVQERVIQRFRALGIAGIPTLDEARYSVARQYDFASWDELVASLAPAPAGARAARAAAPPFYNIKL
jgi:hypothetical protein